MIQFTPIGGMGEFVRRFACLPLSAKIEIRKLWRVGEHSVAIDKTEKMIPNPLRVIREEDDTDADYASRCELVALITAPSTDRAS